MTIVEQRRPIFLNLYLCILAVLATTFAGCGSGLAQPSKQSPKIQWADPASITYGTTLSTLQLNAKASVAGTFVYSPAIGALESAGSSSLSVKFTPTDTQHYSTATASVTLVVNKATPVITWPTPAAITAGTALSTTQLNATASVSGKFTYTPSAGLRLPLGVNLLTAVFTPSNTANYNTATVSTSLVVNPLAALAPTSTNIAVGSSVIQTGMKRVGMNIDGQDFYDSGQMMKNLVFRNPGFEGETWQSIVRCASVSTTSCTGDNPWAQWPANFLTGATYEFITGSAAGQTGTVTSNTAADQNSTGMVLQLSTVAVAPTAGDFVVVRMNIPGNAAAGWWTSTWGGGTLSTELTDLSPNTLGKQALRMTADGSGQGISVDSYFDSTGLHNFVLLNGSYQLTFRAKGVGGNNQLNITFGRQIANGSYFNQTITLTPSWQDYTFSIPASESAATAVGTVDLHFEVDGSDALLDDVSLSAVTSSSNPTVFRDEVVNTLLALKPGSLRYMDGMTDFGSSIDNMITPVGARLRAGSSTQSTEEDDIPIGLHEFLQLCQTVGAEPWYNLPPAISPIEMQHLIEYFAGDASTPYGAKRAALGQVAPWTTVFPMIHMELGNEQWNSGTFPGNSIYDPVAYGSRVATVFAAAKSSATYDSTKFDLIMGSFVLNTWWTQTEVANASSYDSVSVAGYLYGTFNDTSSTEAIFGPMFAEPEMWDSTSSGYMATQSQVVTGAGKKLVTYEENLGTQSGTATQDMVNAVIPSVGGGVTMGVHMLLQMRDLGIQTQNVWALPGFYNSFSNTNGGSETAPLFGTVIDMGGQTNRQRPVFLATQLVNTAILPQMLGTTLTGVNPTWDQPLSTNDNVQLSGAHELQSFAFTDGANQRSLVVVNLSRTAALPVTFSGVNAPIGAVNVSQLTSANLTDTNESASNVNLTSFSSQAFNPLLPYSLPPFSLTVFSWTTP